MFKTQVNFTFNFLMRIQIEIRKLSLSILLETRRNVQHNIIKHNQIDN